MKQLRRTSRAARKVTEGALKGAPKQGPVGVAPARSGDLSKLTVDMTGVEEGLNRVRVGLDKTDVAAKQHAITIQALADTYSGATAIKTAKEAVEAVNVAYRQGVTIGEMAAEQQKAINTAVDAGIEAFRRQGSVAPQAMRDLYLATISYADVNGLGRLRNWATRSGRHPPIAKDWGGSITRDQQPGAGGIAKRSSGRPSSKVKGQFQRLRDSFATLMR